MKMIIVVKLTPYHETSHEHLNSTITSYLPNGIILAVSIR